MDINQQEDFQNEIEAQELKVATRIQEERLARKLSQLDLALEAGISQGYLPWLNLTKKFLQSHKLIFFPIRPVKGHDLQALDSAVFRICNKP